VTDTRQYIEQGDRWVPVPGSGDVSICERCGREHEVHALVELGSGRSAVVGTGCATRGSMVATRLRSAASAAKRLRQLTAQRLALKARLDELLAIEAAVLALPLPELVVTGAPQPYQPERLELRMGDAKCFSVSGEVSEERRRCVVSGWRRNREVERRPAAWATTYKSVTEAALEDLDDKIARAEKATRNIAIA